MERSAVLVIFPSWVGDMVMAHALIQRLMVIHPHRRIEVLAPAWSVSLLERMPGVNRVIPSTLQHGKLAIKLRYQLAKQCQQTAYCCAYVLPNTFKSAWIPWLAHIPKRVGWRGEWRYGLLNDIRVLDKARYPLMVQRYLALGFAESASFDWTSYRPKLLADAEKIPALIKQYQLSTTLPVVVLCPGAQYGPSKQWPLEHFASLANRSIEEGYAVWLLGGPSEASLIAAMNQATQNRCKDLSRTSLAEAVDVLSLAHCVVSNDSGLMHVAAALERPLVALYGSSSPDFTPPLSQDAQILSLDLPCKPCFKRTCPLKHHRCMRDMTPEQVFAIIQSL